MVPSRSSRCLSASGETRSYWRWKTELCSIAPPILWTLVTTRSASASMPQAGSPGWKGRWAPQASSRIRGTSNSWHTRATPRTSVQVPQSVGVISSMPLASGCSWRRRRTSSGSGGWAMCRSRSNLGWTQIGSTPLTTTPEITDLCALRDSSSFSPGPAAASMAVLTDSELPHVEKNARSAPTASAISSCAWLSTPWDWRRSSSPLRDRTSERNTSSPTITATRGSTPRPCLCPGGPKTVSPRRRNSSSTGTRE